MGQRRGRWACLCLVSLALAACSQAHARRAEPATPEGSSVENDLREPYPEEEGFDLSLPLLPHMIVRPEEPTGPASASGASGGETGASGSSGGETAASGASGASAGASGGEEEPIGEVLAAEVFPEGEFCTSFPNIPPRRACAPRSDTERSQR